MPTVEVSREAEADLEGIYLYGFAAHGERQADRYQAELIQAFDLLAQSPGLRRRDERRCAGFARTITLFSTSQRRTES